MLFAMPNNDPTETGGGPASGLRRARTNLRWSPRVAVLALIAVAWLGISSVGGPLIGQLSQVQENDNANFLPASAESTELAKLSERFTDAQTFPAFVVIERPGGITAQDTAAAADYATSLADRPIELAAGGGPPPRVGDYLAPVPTAVVPSQDGEALLLPVLLDGAKAGGTLPDGESVVGQVVDALRVAASEDLRPTGLRTSVTGPAGFTADLVTAFGGIDGRLLVVSLVTVFVILLLVYRSPLLPLAALVTSGFALAAAALVVYPLADSRKITLDGQSQGILSILVIGAATDYTLLMVARYREELHDHTDRYLAMRRAWRGSVEPIAASGATVILGLLCLLLSELGSTRGLGPVGAFGIAASVLGALTLLPVLLVVPSTLLGLVALALAFGIGSAAFGPAGGAVLALVATAGGGYLAVRRWQVLRAWADPGLVDPDVVDPGAPGAARSALPWYARTEPGRWLFWPRAPRVDHLHRIDVSQAAPDLDGGGWARVARLIRDRPRLVWALTLAGLMAAALFVPTLKADGISTSQIFRTTVESVTGQETLSAHFPGGAGSPAQLVVPEGDAEQALDVVKAVPGVSSAVLTAGPASGTPPRPGPPVVVDGQVQIEATLQPAADSPAAEEVVRRLRDSVDEVGQDVLVGGTTAVALDVREASRRDLVVILPAVLGVIFLVLVLLLRSVVAPMVLILANVLSFAATLGVSALVFNRVLDYPGGDPSIPLYAFVFLVALGIDYSIFLMTRVREEAVRRGPKPGVLVGLAVTGGVITSAGVVLAATFGALATIPILFLQQIAFVVAFGVLLDTLVVRSLLVPAVAYDLGPRVWWRSRLSNDLGTSGSSTAAPEASRVIR
jgi:putative drug exporter of the RND superfamily